MATVISKEELDAHASAMLERAWAGEEIVIEQRGAPRLRLVPIDQPEPLKRRVPGSMRGQFSYAPDAFDPLTDDELREWGLL